MVLDIYSGGVCTLELFCCMYGSFEKIGAIASLQKDLCPRRKVSTRLQQERSFNFFEEDSAVLLRVDFNALFFAKNSFSQQLRAFCQVYVHPSWAEGEFEQETRRQKRLPRDEGDEFPLSKKSFFFLYRKKQAPPRPHQTREVSSVHASLLSFYDRQ